MDDDLYFGGSFNPPHLAHVACAAAAASAIGASGVVLVPTGSPALKNAAEVAPAVDRLAMTRLAAADAGAAVSFAVDDSEVRRAGTTYTVDTVAALKAKGVSPVQWLIGGRPSFEPSPLAPVRRPAPRRLAVGDGPAGVRDRLGRPHAGRSDVAGPRRDRAADRRQRDRGPPAAAGRAAGRRAARPGRGTVRPRPPALSDNATGCHRLRAAWRVPGRACR